MMSLWLQKLILATTTTDRGPSPVAHLTPGIFSAPELVVVADDRRNLAVKLPTTVPDDKVVQTASTQAAGRQREDAQTKLPSLSCTIIVRTLSGCCFTNETNQSTIGTRNIH